MNRIPGGFCVVGQDIGKEMNHISTWNFESRIRKVEFGSTLKARSLPIGGKNFQWLYTGRNARFGIKIIGGYPAAGTNQDIVVLIEDTDLILQKLIVSNRVLEGKCLQCLITFYQAGEVRCFLFIAGEGMSNIISQQKSRLLE